jgi:hypothetical protein
MRRTLISALALLALYGCDDSKPTGNHDLSVGDMTGGCAADNSACMSGGQNLLCKSGSCSPCTDTVDDANCATAYGAGNVCSAGACQMGACHDSSTCNGQICDSTSGTCVPCKQDPDCPTATPYCDTSTGKCSTTPPPCTSGTACGTAGFCCNGRCIDPGECCNDTQCTSGTCTKFHTCSTCIDTAPVDQFYVDPSAQAGSAGVGSMQCPFKAIGTAIYNVPSPAPTTGFTICTRGTFDGTNTKNWPIYVPQYVTLDGSYCNPSPSPVPHTAFNVPDGNGGVSFVQNGPGAIQYYDIVYQPGPSPKPTSGIFVSNTTPSTGAAVVTVQEVTISKFFAGMKVTQRQGDTNPGYVNLADNSILMSNTWGLLISAGGNVYARTSLSSSLTAFDENVNAGVWLDQGSLNAEGKVYTGPDLDKHHYNLEMDGNLGNGILVTSPSAYLTLEASDVSSNSSNGLKSLATAHIITTYCWFKNNTGGNGIHVYNDQSNSGDNPQYLSIGGYNTITGNSHAQICASGTFTGGAVDVTNDYWTNDYSSSTCTTGTNCGNSSLDVAVPSGFTVTGCP